MNTLRELLSNTALLGIIITGILGPICVIYFKHVFYQKKTLSVLKKEEFNLTVRNQNIINNSLNQLQEQLSIDRLIVFQFHNGGNFWPNNQSMKKMSVTFESTAPSISTDIFKMQNIPVSFFSGVLESMIDSDNHAFFNIQKVKDNALRFYWESRGVSCVYLFPVQNLEGLLVGILGVEQTHNTLLSAESIHKLSDESKRMSGYLSYIIK